MTLAVLMTLTLPALVYSHALSPSSTDAKYMAKPNQVSTWKTFGEDVAAACADLDSSDACHRPMPFPAREDRAFLIEVTACVSYETSHCHVRVCKNHSPDNRCLTDD